MLAQLRSPFLAPLLLIAALLAFASCKPADGQPAATPVERHGALSAVGNRIVGQHGHPISLAGPSLFWSNDGWEADRFYNASVVEVIAEDWDAGIIRAAIGVEGDGGYLEAPESNRAKAETVVDAAIANGLYVLVDWHSHHAENHIDEAISFFDAMSKKYGDEPNVISEIYNEPLKVSWSEVLKPYALQVIAAIRANDPDNLIIMGTPNWSQKVDEAAEDPITQYENIAYTLHFYAGTHGEELRERARAALGNGIALMVTEWGTVLASGDGEVFPEETAEWILFMKKHQLSHCNWSLHDKQEAASMLKPGASSTGPWPRRSLTRSGTLVKQIIDNWNESPRALPL